MNYLLPITIYQSLPRLGRGAPLNTIIEDSEGSHCGTRNGNDDGQSDDDSNDDRCSRGSSIMEMLAGLPSKYIGQQPKHSAPIPKGRPPSVVSSEGCEAELGQTSSGGSYAGSVGDTVFSESCPSLTESRISNGTSFATDSSCDSVVSRGGTNRFPALFIPRGSWEGMEKANNDFHLGIITPAAKLLLSPEALERISMFIPSPDNPPSLGDASSTRSESPILQCNPHSPPTPELRDIDGGGTVWQQHGRLSLNTPLEIALDDEQSLFLSAAEAHDYRPVSSNYIEIMHSFPLVPGLTPIDTPNTPSVPRAVALDNLTGESGVQLPAQALAMLNSLDKDQYTESLTDASSSAEDNEEMQECPVPPTRPHTWCDESPETEYSVSGFSIPSPSGFFSSLKMGVRNTWCSPTRKASSPPPSSATAENFYKAPWTSSTQIKETILEHSKDNDDDATEGPPSVKTATFDINPHPPEKMEDDDMYGNTRKLVCNHEYEEAYEETLLLAAEANMGRTSDWLTAQNTYIRILREPTKVGDPPGSRGGPKAAHVEDPPDSHVESVSLPAKEPSNPICRPKTEPVATDPDSPHQPKIMPTGNSPGAYHGFETVPPGDPPISRTRPVSDPPSSRTTLAVVGGPPDLHATFGKINSLGQERRKAARALQRSKSMSSPSETTFLQAFTYQKSESKDNDVFLHASSRLDNVQSSRIATPKRHVLSLLNTHTSKTLEPAHARPKYRGPLAQDPRNTIEITRENDQAKFQTLERQQTALKAIKPNIWSLEAQRTILYNGRLMANRTASERLDQIDTEFHHPAPPDQPGCPIKRRPRILDLGGAATASWAWAAASRWPNAKIITVQTNQQAELARSYAANKDDYCDTPQTPTNHKVVSVPHLWTMPFRDNYFDVISARTLHMYLRANPVPGMDSIDEWDMTLKECMRVLKPGGVLDYFVMDSGICNGEPSDVFNVNLSPILTKSHDPGDIDIVNEFKSELQRRGYEADGGCGRLMSRLKQEGFIGVRRQWIGLPIGRADYGAPKSKRHLRGASTNSANTHWINPCLSESINSRLNFRPAPRPISEVSDIAKIVDQYADVEAVQGPVGSTADVADVSALLGELLWEEWLVRLRIESGKYTPDSILDGVDEQFGKWRRTGNAAWRGVLGWARKPSRKELRAVEEALAANHVPPLYAPSPRHDYVPPLYVRSPMRNQLPRRGPAPSHGQTPPHHVPLPQRGQVPPLHSLPPQHQQDHSNYTHSSMRSQVPRCGPAPSHGQTPPHHVPSPQRGQVPPLHSISPQEQEPSSHTPSPKQDRSPPLRSPLMPSVPLLTMALSAQANIHRSPSLRRSGRRIPHTAGIGLTVNTNFDVQKPAPIERLSRAKTRPHKLRTRITEKGESGVIPMMIVG